MTPTPQLAVIYWSNARHAFVASLVGENPLTGKLEEIVSIDRPDARRPDVDAIRKLWPAVLVLEQPRPVFGEL